MINVNGRIFEKGFKLTIRNRYIIPQEYICFEYKPTTLYLYDPWREGGLIYGYTDRYNIKSIDIDDILEKVEI